MSKQRLKTYLVRLKESNAVVKLTRIAVIAFATWLDREAVLLLLVLEICFFILEFMQSGKDR